MIYGDFYNKSFQKLPNIIVLYCDRNFGEMTILSH